MNDDFTPDDLKQKLSSMTVLESARSNSCYGMLRSIINICTFLGVLSSLSIITLGSILLFHEGIDSGIQTLGPLVALFGIGFLGLVFTIASKQASLLLVDITDILIQQNR